VTGVASGPRILLVEDDPSTRQALARDLAARSYRIQEAADARTALEHWEDGRPDVVLLDLGLPDTDGIHLLRRMRREAATPIVILSAREDERTKIEALEAGADDYVTKPFSVGELNARLGAILRRALGPVADPNGRIRVGTIQLDPSRHEVRVRNQVLDLTPREFEILRVFLSHAGRLVTRGRLLRAVWGEAYSGEDHYIHVYVSQLRRKIAEADPDGSLADLIVTEPGVGYRIRGPDRRS
jgi:two-component system KDP operon response regulator KdpE